jgi:transcriptional regulator with XRE-family HTH domain
MHYLSGVLASASMWCMNRAVMAARTAAGLTQRQLADLIGTKQSVIARLEDADDAGHSLSMLKRIADALGKRMEIRFAPANRRASRSACAEGADPSSRMRILNFSKPASRQCIQEALPV